MPVLAVFGALGCLQYKVAPILAQDLPDWENPAVFARNQMPGHARVVPFPDETSALSLTPRESSYFLSLNGRWSLHWARNLK